MGESYNSDDFETVIIIAPHGEYMLIGQINAQRSLELTISYKKVDGSWSDRIEVPYYCDGFLALSPGGKYLFFENEGMFWVNTSFIEET